MREAAKVVLGGLIAVALAYAVATYLVALLWPPACHLPGGGTGLCVVGPQYALSRLLAAVVVSLVAGLAIALGVRRRLRRVRSRGSVGGIQP